MTRALAANMKGLAIFAALTPLNAALGALCFSNELWLYVAVPVWLAAYVSVTGYGIRGEAPGQVIANALTVLFLAGVMSGIVFLFWHAASVL